MQEVISTSILVSIHTRVKRVTFLLGRLPQINNCFNPHPREAGDNIQILTRDFTDVSIHTRVKRVTLAPYGCFVGDRVSIHTRVKRVTLMPEQGSVQLSVSIHTRVKRVTSLPISITNLNMLFQSTPA